MQNYESKIQQSESRIQQEIVKYFKNNFCLKHHSPRSMIFHIPNQNQHKLVSIGVYPGAADLFVVHLGKCMFMEVKEPQKGKQSDSQIEFQNHCQEMNIPYFIVYSVEDFKKCLNL